MNSLSIACGQNTTEMPTVLVIDDTPENLHILVEMLCDTGYKVLPAISGYVAIKAIEKTRPDLILLDIMMPAMNGYDLCQIIKSNPETSDIPIIFISSLNGGHDKVKAFKMGGVDYITKPFNSEEVMARVVNHLKISFLQRKLKEQNQKLKEAAEFKEEVERVIHHDLRSPLGPILNLPATIKKIGDLTDKQKRFIDLIEKCGQRMSDILNYSINLTKIEKAEFDKRRIPLDLIDVFKIIHMELGLLIEEKDTEITITVNQQPIEEHSEFPLTGNLFLIQSMLTNLVRNAIEASPDHEQVTIDLSNESDVHLISIHNQGVIPEHIQDRFFEKYVTSGKKHGSGLGSYIAKKSADAIGAQIGFKSDQESGTTLTIRFPKTSRIDQAESVEISE